MKNLVRDRRKDILKLLAALRLRDAYAMRKLVRRLALPVLAFAVVAAAASPAWAKQITDEELMAFLKSPAVPAKTSAPAAAPSALTSTEGGSKPASLQPIAKAAESAPVAGRMVVDPKSGARRYELPSFVPLPKDAPAETRKIKGTVGVKIPSGMSVVYDKDRRSGATTEIWVNFTDGIRLSGVKSAQGFDEGDIVEVELRETKDKTQRAVTALSMVREKSDEERAREAAAERAADTRDEKKSIEGNES